MPLATARAAAIQNPPRLRIEWRTRLADIACVVVPGWHGSGPDHWQRRWLPSLTAAVVTEQADWERPTVVDWVSTLNRTVRGLVRPVMLVAHSLGCITVAHWAGRFGGGQVIGALLVAPADVERPNGPAALRPFAPIPRRPLPFPSLVIGSSNDPAASPGRAAGFAAAWGGRFICMKNAGHINVASGHRDWIEGRELLENWARAVSAEANARAGHSHGLRGAARLDSRHSGAGADMPGL